MIRHVMSPAIVNQRFEQLLSDTGVEKAWPKVLSPSNFIEVAPLLQSLLNTFRHNVFARNQGQNFEDEVC